MRRWAVPCLDAGQRKLVDEMGAHGVAGLFTADGLFEVELKELDGQRHKAGLYSVVSSHTAIQSKTKIHFNFSEVGSIPVLHWHSVFSTCPPPNQSFFSRTGLCDDTSVLLIF